jgi:hypothetical protein
MYMSMNIELITCCECKVPFAIPEWHMKRLQTTGERFYCPNGHGQMFTNSEVQRLRMELAGVKAENARLKTAAKNAEKAAQKVEDRPPEKPKEGNGKPNVYDPEGRAELVQKIAALRKEGKSIRKLAEELKVPSGTVAHLAWEYQIKPDGTIGGKRVA